ncbi:MAG TPA: PPC domain-containing DNA-binding protein [Methylomirabilota bacterium]|nr:PPC domain-containing DNA-binding protein [Methylomirabilota bacterium]
MEVRLLNESHGQRTIVVVFDDGEEVVGGLTDVATRHELSGAYFSAIGAFSAATLGFFDVHQKDYVRIPITQQVEVVSLAGNIALNKGKPKLHAHAVVAKRDGAAMGGHLLEAHVRPTLEVVLVESPRPLKRRTDEATGLALIDLSR